MAMKTGLQTMEEAAKAAGGGGGDRLDWFSAKEGESRIIRFVEEADTWITILMFASVPTKPKPAGWENKWPKSMSAVDRLDPQLTQDLVSGKDEDANTPLYTDCYISANIKDEGTYGDGGLFSSKPRGMVIAIEREGVYEGGRLVGVKDKMVEYEVERNGKKEKVTRPKFVKVNQAYGNFFAKFKGFFGHYGTVLDRDYVCERESKQDWNITPLDPITLGESNPFGVPAGTKLDLRNAEIAKHYEPPQTSLEIVLYMASDEYHERFFIPGKGEPTPAASDQQVTQTATPPQTDASEDKIAAMAAMVKGYSQGGAPPEAPTDTTPPQADEVPPTPESEPAASGGGLRAM